MRRRFSNVEITESEVSPTIEAGGGMGGNNMPMVLESNQNHATAKETETCTTLPSSMGMGGGYVPMVVEGADLFNQSITGTVAMTMSNRATDAHHVPCVIEQKVISSSKASFFMQITEDKASVLVATDYKDPPIVIEDKQMAEEIYALENHPNDSRMKIDPNGKVQALSGRMGTGGNNTPMAMVAYRKTAHPQNSEQPQTYEPTEKADTLNVYDNSEGRTPTVAVEGNGARPSHHGDGYIESDQSYTLNTTEVHGVATMEDNNYRVRRLTPTECERLQGYPDGWTDIGEWVDSKGKVRKTTDSARYKALGNSIGLPPWKWVLKRIAAQYERDCTMASLFDGIGGFPLAFQRAGAKPVWASEIEEFPIAVTKKHFPDSD